MTQQEGERASGDRPLRVLELGTWLAAPGAGALLADRGADVIKVEPPGGDPGRNFVAALGGEETDYAPSFALLNRGKRSVILDLSDAGDRGYFDTLLAEADILITNLRSGSLHRLGLEPEATLNAFPRLIYASITGLGLRGAEQNEPTYDVGGFWARSGLMAQLQIPGAGPPSPTGGYGDIVTSLAVYAGIMSALYDRERTGKGALVETSLAQVGAFVMGGDLAVEAVRGNLKAQRPRDQCRTPLVNSYQAGCGQWFFLTGIEARRHFPYLCRALDRPDLLHDPRFATARLIRVNSAELIKLLDKAFLTRPLSEWRVAFAREAVCWQPIATAAQVMEDRQLHDNGVFVPIWSGKTYTQMAAAPFTLDRESRTGQHAPDLPPDGKQRLYWKEREEQSPPPVGPTQRQAS